MEEAETAGSHFVFDVDQYSSALCPMPVLTFGYDDDGDCPTQERDVCHQDLYVVWSFSNAVYLDDPPVITRTDAATDAITDAWELRCPVGHVIARSSGEESAETFEWESLFGKVTPKPPE